MKRNQKEIGKRKKLKRRRQKQVCVCKIEKRAMQGQMYVFTTVQKHWYPPRGKSNTNLEWNLQKSLYFMLHTILVDKLYREQKIQQSTRQSNFDRLSQYQFQLLGYYTFLSTQM